MNKIIYLDAAASMQKPKSVIDTELDFLRNSYANSGRGVCARATAVDDMVVNVRHRVAEFIGASANQIVFTSGATDSLNRVVHLIGGARKVVAVSDLDHHSARLPWQMRVGTEIVIWPLDNNNNIDVTRVPYADVYIITAMSNVFGVPQDVSVLVCAAREKNPNAIIVVDAAQYVVHEKINADAWGVDFICFSGHKIGTDTGVGVLYVRDATRWLPDKFGGGMVLRIDGDSFVFNSAPEVFEAGTLPLTQIVGLAPAIDNIEHSRPDLNLIKYMYDELSKNPRIHIVTTRDAALLTFWIEDMNVLDFGVLVGAHGICLRVGNMCASWAMHAIGVPGAVRISVGHDNTIADARAAIDIINKVIK